MTAASVTEERGSDPKPGIAYKALARSLTGDILSGKFPEGDRLPTEAELADRHGVSRQTVRRAYQDLVSDGMVYRVPGKGTFATPSHRRYMRRFGSVEEILALSIDTAMETLTPFRRTVDIGAARRLQQETDLVAAGTVRRLHEGVPFCVTDIYVPVEIGTVLSEMPELAEPGATSEITVIGSIERVAGRRAAQADMSLTAVPAPAGIARRVNIEPGQPVLHVDRLYRDENQTPLELAISHFHPQRYTYRVHLRRHTP